MGSENLSDGLNDIFSNIVNEESLNLPFTVESDIISDFKEKCQIYFNLLNDYTENNDTGLSKRISRRLEKIIEIYFGLVTSLSEFLSGDIKAAYDSFDRTFSDNVTSRYIHHISTPLNKLCNESKPLFRVRKSDTSIKRQK
ncbi:hypothetical protein ACHWUR_05430 [Klebsiella pneumoniae]